MGVLDMDDTPPLYDDDDGMMFTACRIANTVIPEVVGCKEFWMFMCFNLTVSILRHLDIFEPTKYHIDLPWALTGVTGGLMTFFVCFYNSHVFKRYNILYEITQGMCEAVLELAVRLRVEVPHHRQLQRKIIQLALASTFVFFFELSPSKEIGHGSQVSRREWRVLVNLRLLNTEEVHAMRVHCKHLGEDGLPSLICLFWAMQLLHFHTENQPDREDMLAGFFGNLLHLRKRQADVVQDLELPMPFQYFHIMNFMLVLNLLLWAYALGCQNTFFAPLIYGFVQTVFQGIRELSTGLSNPFGSDDVDFPVQRWIWRLYRRVWMIIESDLPADAHKPNRMNEFMHPRDAAAIVNMQVDLNVEE